MAAVIDLYASLSRVPVDLSLVPPEWWDATVSSQSTVSVLYDSTAQLPAGIQDFAAWALAPSALSGLYDNDLLQPLEQLLPLIPALASYWQDVPVAFRDAAAVFDGHVVSIPYSAEVPLLFYRRDLFERLGLAPPASWEEMLAVAARINGTTAPCLTNSSRECEQYGFCFGFPAGCFYDGLALTTIWASMVGSYGTKEGLFFRPKEMKPLFTGPAMAEALRIYAALSDLGPGGLGPCGRLTLDGYVQRCAMGLGLANSFKAIMFVMGDRAQGRLGAALLPGSHRVQSRASGQLEPCTPALCPYGITVVDSVVHNGTVIVSRVPYLGRGAFSFAVNRRAPPHQALAALRAFTLAMTHQGGWPFTLDPSLVTMTVRASHLSSASIDRWAAAGYGKYDTLGFLGVMADSIRHPCMALGLRVAGGGRIAATMSWAAVAAAVNRTSAEALLEHLDQSYGQVLQTYYGGDVAKLQQAYWRDIGYRPTAGAAGGGDDDFADSAVPTPPQQLSADGGGGRVGGLSPSGILAVALAVAVAAVVLLAAAVALTVRRERYLRARAGARVVAAPGYSPDTSLCITDIQSSTLLWEELSPAVMDAALSLHNGCVRGLLAKHLGYECHTEGDSFVVAFPTAVHAVECALELQVALMQLPWPPEILQHPECATMHSAAGGVPATAGAGAGGGLPAAGRSHTAIYMHPLLLLAHLSGSKGHALSPQAFGGATAGTAGSGGSGTAAAAATVGGGTEASPGAAGLQAQTSVSDRALSYTSGFVLPYAMTSTRWALGGGIPTAAAAEAAEAAALAEAQPEASLPQLQLQLRDAADGATVEGRTGLDVEDIAAAPDAAAAAPPPPLADTAAKTATAPVAGLRMPAPALALALRGSSLSTSMTTPAAAATLGQSSLGHAPSGRVLVFRGFRVRVGICSGLIQGRDVVYCKDHSRRTAYSGTCMQLTKLVSDAAVGGMVLLGGCTVERLLPLPRRDMPGLIVWHKGRFEIPDKDAKDLNPDRTPPFHQPHPHPHPPDLAALPESLSSVESRHGGYGAGSGPTAPRTLDLYQAMCGSLAARQLLLDRLPLRTGPRVLPGVLAAPLGYVTLAAVAVVGLRTLRAWDEAVTGQALGLLYTTAMAELRSAGGYPAEVEAGGGRLLAAFSSAPAAILWLLRTEEELRCTVAWPPKLLAHELGEELLVALAAPSHRCMVYGEDAAAAVGGGARPRSPSGAAIERRELTPAQSLRVSGGGCSGSINVVRSRGNAASGDGSFGGGRQLYARRGNLAAAFSRLQHQMSHTAAAAAASSRRRRIAPSFMRRSVSENGYMFGKPAVRPPKKLVVPPVATSGVDAKAEIGAGVGPDPAVSGSLSPCTYHDYRNSVSSRPLPLLAPLSILPAPLSLPLPLLPDPLQRSGTSAPGAAASASTAAGGTATPHTETVEKMAALDTGCDGGCALRRLSGDLTSYGPAGAAQSAPLVALGPQMGPRRRGAVVLPTNAAAAAALPAPPPAPPPPPQHLHGPVTACCTGAVYPMTALQVLRARGGRGHLPAAEVRPHSAASASSARRNLGRGISGTARMASTPQMGLETSGSSLPPPRSPAAAAGSVGTGRCSAPPPTRTCPRREASLAEPAGPVSPIPSVSSPRQVNGDLPSRAVPLRKSDGGGARGGIAAPEEGKEDEASGRGMSPGRPPQWRLQLVAAQHSRGVSVDDNAVDIDVSSSGGSGGVSTPGRQQRMLQRQLVQQLQQQRQFQQRQQQLRPLGGQPTAAGASPGSRYQPQPQPQQHQEPPVSRQGSGSEQQPSNQHSIRTKPAQRGANIPAPLRQGYHPQHETRQFQHVFQTPLPMDEEGAQPSPSPSPPPASGETSAAALHQFASPPPNVPPPPPPPLRPPPHHASCSFVEQRLLRGLRMRCGLEEGSFFYDGSVSAARLYRSQHGGRPYMRLMRLVDNAPVGQVVASAAVVKRVQRAAAAGDVTAQQLRLVPLSAFTATATVSPQPAAATATIPGNAVAPPQRLTLPPSAAAVDAPLARCSYRAPQTGLSRAAEAQASAKARGAGLRSWEAVEAEEPAAAAPPGGRHSSRGRTQPEPGAGGGPGAQAWVCTWARGP